MVFFVVIAVVAAGIKPANAPAVNIEAHAADGRKRARGVQPGSFMSLMINSKHQDGRGVSDEEATSQAFTFLLAGYETTVSPLAHVTRLLQTEIPLIDSCIGFHLEMDHREILVTRSPMMVYTHRDKYLGHASDVRIGCHTRAR